MKFSLSKLVSVLLIVNILSGCGTVGIFSSQDSNQTSNKRAKSSDTVIYTNAIRQIQNIRRNLNSSVQIVVLKGRLLVVGYVDSPDEHLRLTNMLWGIAGVQEVIDHLEYTPEERRGGFSIANSLLKTQLDAKLLTQRKLVHSNFKYVVFKDNLYVLACPAAEAEKDVFFILVRKLPQVKKVFFYDMHR